MNRHNFLIYRLRLQPCQRIGFYHDTAAMTFIQVAFCGAYNGRHEFAFFTVCFFYFLDGAFSTEIYEATNALLRDPLPISS